MMRSDQMNEEKMGFEFKSFESSRLMQLQISFYVIWLETNVMFTLFSCAQLSSWNEK
jgi:hypothetical protein